MNLCDLKNRFLYECRPDLFPPMLTSLEIELWALYYPEKELRIKSRSKHG